MPLDLKDPVKLPRFAWVLQGTLNGPDEAFDEDLARYDEAAVLPTRGALVAEWLLVVPRVSCLSVAELNELSRSRLLAIADNVLAQVSLRAGSSVLFEHGPGRQGSAVGCGLDHAHLHVVGGAPDLLDRLVEQVEEAKWSSVDHADPWLAVPAGSDYLLVRDHRRAVRALIDSPTSQRLRQAFAVCLGREHEWDYRLHPNITNARLTKEMFRGAFTDATV